MSESEIDAKEYLSSDNWKNAKIVDKEYTFKRYNIPENVQIYIENNWKKINDINGGTYERPKE